MKNTLFFFFFLLTAGWLFAQPSIERIEPPNWWAGMHDANLQLLVYGKDIGSLKPIINYPGVAIKQSIRVENDNYLFIDLVLAEEVKAGTFDIQFFDKRKVAITKKYTLHEREAGSATRNGFDQSDVLYLITPDRFVNGDEANDSIVGLSEGLNRSFDGGRHGGDIKGIADRLDYINDMGFTAIWLNPVLENNMDTYSYHGYSTTDYYKVDPRYGSNEEYQELSRVAKSKGITLIMDMIVNHCGLAHWWMKDLPCSDWINNQNGPYMESNHRKTTIQDPHAAEADRIRFTDGWFVPSMPDLNQRNRLMANYLTQNSIWWIEFAGLSGIRMDTYPYPDMHYMTEWTEKVMAEYPNFNIVGEEWFETQPAIVAYWQKGKTNPNGYSSELRSLMDFPLRYALTNALIKEESFHQGWGNLYEILGMDFLYADPLELVIFPDNHDMSRFFTQVNGDYDLFKLGISFYMTTRGTPQIYYGTEILMQHEKNAGHGIIRSDFPGGWKGDATNGFTGEGLSQQQKEGQQFMKRLLQWRKKASAIHHGKLMHFVPQDKVYVYFRYDDDQKIMVILNKNKEPYILSLARFSEMMEGYTKAHNIINNKTFTLGKEITLDVMEPMILELK